MYYNLIYFFLCLCDVLVASNWLIYIYWNCHSGLWSLGEFDDVDIYYYLREICKIIANRKEEKLFKCSCINKLFTWLARLGNG